MPTYSYLCKACNHSFEILQSFSEEALTKCPKCEGELRKQFGNLGVSFKGSGFYRTDSQASSEPAPPASSD
jgi:putative FmdB family regulatory protein